MNICWRDRENQIVNGKIILAIFPFLYYRRLGQGNGGTWLSKFCQRVKQALLLLILVLTFSALWITSSPSMCLKNDGIIETYSIETFQPFIKGNGSKIPVSLYGQQNGSFINVSMNHFFTDDNRRSDTFVTKHLFRFSFRYLLTPV